MSRTGGEPVTTTQTGTGRETAQKRILTVLILGQLLAGAGLAAGVTVGARQPGATMSAARVGSVSPTP